MTINEIMIMISSVVLKNFGPLVNINWSNLGPVNLVIGGNDCGKTFLLKILYGTMRTLETYRRGNEKRTVAEILAEKLYWTFQPDKIGDLVTKGSNPPLSCAIELNQHLFRYEFGKDTTKQISSLTNQVPPRKANSIFLPAKEVLSLYHIILKSREWDKDFGFDDTYLDLVRALRYPAGAGENDPAFISSRRKLEAILGGKVEYEETSRRWQFRKGHQKFSIGVTAEGIKKIAILDSLLGNRYLDNNSIIFIDEPESALHPAAVSQLLNIIYELTKSGIQFFLASHSYFVVKKLFLIAQKENISIPVLSGLDSQWRYADLKDEMPDNSIIDESIRLYREEVGLSLQ